LQLLLGALQAQHHRALHAFAQSSSGVLVVKPFERKLEDAPFQQTLQGCLCV